MSGYARLGELTKTKWNDNFDAIELKSAYSDGRGVLYGCGLTDSGGVTITIGEGVIIGLKGTPIDERTYDVTNNSTKFIWINEDGTVIETATSADPGGDYVCLGKVTTASGDITSLTSEGRVLLPRFTSLRSYEIGDALTVFDLVNGRVGIGTDSPDHVLDVVGGASADYLALPEGSAPSVVADHGILYSKEVTGDTELFWLMDDSTEVQLTSGGAVAVGAHASTHLPNGSDEIDWDGKIHMSGTAASRPAASASNNGALYFATDTNGGTLYRSNGATWSQISLGLTEVETLGRTTVSNAAYVILSTDKYVAQTGTMSASRAFTLPAANSVSGGYAITIADESGTVSAINTIVVTRAGSDTIEGGTTHTLATGYSSVTLYSDGSSKWTTNAARFLRKSNNLSDVSSASSARTNLGLAIGTDVQAYDAELAAIAGLTSAADSLPYFTGSGTAALATFTSYGRSLVDDADAATARSTLGLGSIATQASNSVSITGGTITGITDLAVADGGTGSSTALGALANLGIGFAKLTGDQTCSATTTVTNITGLSFSVTSGLYYEFEFVLVVQSDTSTTGVRVTLTTPTFTIFSAVVSTCQSTDGTLGSFMGNITSSGDEVTSALVAATGTDYIMLIKGVILPSANGTVQLQGACEVASGNVKFRQASMVRFINYG